MRNAIEVNVNDYCGNLLLVDAYLEDKQIPVAALQLPAPTITVKSSPEALHMDKLGFELCTICRLRRIERIACVFKERSPHSIRIPLMVQEAADNTGFPRGSQCPVYPTG